MFTLRHLHVVMGDVACVALEETLLVDSLTMPRLRYLVHFHLVVGGHAQVFAICCHCKLVDLGGRGVNRYLH